MKRADLRVGMHVRTGMNRSSEFYRSEGIVLDTGPWKGQKWNYANRFVQGHGSGVAIAERNGSRWLPQVVQLGAIAPYEETVQAERRAVQATQEYRQAEQLREKLWKDEVDDLNERIGTVLQIEPARFISGGRERPHVSISIGVLRDLVERAK